MQAIWMRFPNDQITKIHINKENNVQAVKLVNLAPPQGQKWLGSSC